MSILTSKTFELRPLRSSLWVPRLPMFIQVLSFISMFRISNLWIGHDSWSVEEATRYFEAALIIEQEVGISLTHETHRQRVFNSPYTFHSIIKQPQLANLKINADLSHWVCLCEHVFDSKKFPERDVWWPEVLRLVAKHAAFIHARVGHQQGPQVSDPRAPEFDYLLKSHLSWWKEVFFCFSRLFSNCSLQIISNQRSRGREICYLEPEFGPPPYAFIYLLAIPLSLSGTCRHSPILKILSHRCPR